ncbi:MAG TPA: ABC transporter permease [Candidatus Binataceae bacterium]|nr:ABC transporter permease [Candidatus Binataceae bacterium]
MLRAISLTIQNEARLLIRDPVALLMLLFAPVVIITVAGYSLGSLYGGVGNSYRLPIVNLDRGPAADAIVKALEREHSISVELLDDTGEARRLVSERDRTPLAIEIPSGTSAGVAEGREPRLILFVDPVRRIEVDALELRIGELCRKVTEAARATAQQQLEASQKDLGDKLTRLSSEIEGEQSHARSQFAQTQTALQTSIRTQTAAALRQASDQAQAAIKLRENRAWSDLQNQLSARQKILLEIQSYLAQLQTSQRAFEDWLAKLKSMAGSHASDIPPSPSFPAPVSEADLAELAKPITPPKIDTTVPTELSPNLFAIKIPQLLERRGSDLKGEFQRFESSPIPTLPGDLGFLERPAIDGEATVVNAFDQYVPGFGITFLLIGMMFGIALTLFDERDWGTLRRLQISGAPLPGLVLGKLIARFIVGVIQMMLLFGVGWLLFGISLGREPIALLIPSIGISFAAAALGLVIASISRAHDSVMPLGTVISMAMAAIGGCWWPLDFEPAWMRGVARWIPTTWTMQAFNDLMIRNRAPSSVLWPFAATVGLGMLFLILGLARFVRLED